MCETRWYTFCTDVFIEFRTVQGGDLGQGETWRAVRQVSVWATAVESVDLYLSYGKEGCARVKCKIVLFLGDKLFIIIIIIITIIIIIIMVEYTLEQRIFLYDAYVKNYSTRRCLRKFQRQFEVVRIPSRSTIHDLVNEDKRTRSFLNKKRVQQRRVPAEEKLHEVRARFLFMGNHGRLVRWRKWRACGVGEAKEGLENELWRR